MINIAFDVLGNKLSNISVRTIAKDVLLDRWPDAVIIQGEYGELMKMRQPITLVNGVITDAPPPTAEQLEAWEIERLTTLAEETALIHGSQILDPITNQPAADPTLPIDEIRKQTGKARVNLVYLKKRGDANGKSKANKAQSVEENVALEVAETVQAIQAKTVTTDQEVIDRIQAVVITN